MLWKFKELEDRKASGETLPGGKSLIESGYVDVRTFVEDILGLKGYIFPSILYDLERTFDPGVKITEVVKIDGIGSGKSTYAVLCTAYMLYLMHFLPDPAASLGLMPRSRLYFTIAALREIQAKRILFDRLKDFLDDSVWFKNNHKYRAFGGGAIILPGNLCVFCVGGGGETAPTGYSIILGIMDEADLFLKTSHIGDSADQAENVHTQLKQRIRSRFGNGGLLVMVSSARRYSSFVEKRFDQMKKSPTGYVTRRYSWASCHIIKKPWFFANIKNLEVVKAKNGYAREYKFEDVEWDEMGNPYIPHDADLIPIPFEVLDDYELDPNRFLRDKASVHRGSEGSFVKRPDMIKMNPEQKNYIRQDGILLEDFEPLPGKFYYGHIDLAKSQDAAAFAFGHQEARNTIIDFVHVLDPKRGQVIKIEDIRHIIYNLKQLKFRIGLITFDRYQSLDSLQQLQSAGINCNSFSVDENPAAYIMWRDAHYAEEIKIPSIIGYMSNVKALIVNANGKIDHKVGGKDITDAVAGCTYHCRMLGMSGAISIHRKNLLEQTQEEFLNVYDKKQGIIKEDKTVAKGS